MRMARPVPRGATRFVMNLRANIWVQATPDLRRAIFSLSGPAGLT
jgi:hypothetical protein